MTKRTQIKSKFYYIFWGTATVAVCLGQLYVGTGYRVLAQEMLELNQKVDGVLLQRSRDKDWGDYLKWKTSPLNFLRTVYRL